MFLDELDELGCPPDGWEYLSERGFAAALPEWAVVREVPWGHDANGVPCADGPRKRVAYYPGDVPDLRLPSMEPRDYHAGQPENDYPVESSPCWGYFAVENPNGGWDIDESLVSLQHMHFRGTTIIVRGSLSVFLGPMIEFPAGKYFGYHIPEIYRCAVVCDNGGALSKHRMTDGGPGTIQHAIDRIGAKALRERVIEDLAYQVGDQFISRHWREVIGE